MKLLAIWDEYNNTTLKPDICPTILPRHDVPKHGPRMIVDEDDDIGVIVNEQDRESDSAKD